MALKTKVNIKYRTPYLPRVNLPAEQEKIMKHEISVFRKDLIEKQKALERSTQFEADEKLLNQLQEIKVADLNTSSEVWKTWNRLNQLENSRSTSITGKREIEKLQLESLQEAGFDFIKKDNFKKFYQFMNWCKDTVGGKTISSDLIVRWYSEYRNGSVEKIHDEFNKWADNGFEES